MWREPPKNWNFARLNTIVEAEKPPNSSIRIISSIVTPSTCFLKVTIRICFTKSKIQARDNYLYQFQYFCSTFVPVLFRFIGNRKGLGVLDIIGINLPDVENQKIHEDRNGQVGKRIGQPLPV